MTAPHEQGAGMPGSENAQRSTVSVEMARLRLECLKLALRYAPPGREPLDMADAIERHICGEDRSLSFADLKTGRPFSVRDRINAMLDAAEAQTQRVFVIQPGEHASQPAPKTPPEAGGRVVGS